MAVMPARARRILDGMGRVAIASVRFGRAPRTYHQFHAVRGADWVYVTVQAPVLAAGTTPRAESPGLADLAGRRVRARIPLRRAQSGMRMRGTSENVVAHGVTQSVGSGTTAAAQQFAAQPGTRKLLTGIKRAASAAGFAVTSITVTHPDRLAATAQFTVSTRHGFAHRFNAFYPILDALGQGSDGLGWPLRDHCDRLVAQSACGWFVNPRWECPEPGTIGPSSTPAECRKLAGQYPAC
jgi:hypothetical protein